MIFQPALPLRPFVRFYARTESHFSTQVVIQPVPARTAQVIEFALGDPFEVRCEDAAETERSHPVTVVGAQTHRRVCLAMQGRVESFVIVFQPGGLSTLFSLPADLLTNQHFEARVVLGSSIDRLREQIGECPTFAGRVRVADRYLLGQHSTCSGDHGVVAMARALLCQRAPHTVADMAGQVGLGIRQFERRFASKMGLPPKSYARVARFEAALQRKMRSPGLRWTDIAQDLGYYDQMHMVHDFQQLAGATPSVVAPQLDVFVRDEIDATD